MVSSNERTFPVDRRAVWDVLTDGYAYARWVVGTSKIRDVDAGWPAPGTAIHYSVGRGPFRHDGHTESVRVEPERLLELEAHAWPAGSARIVLTLYDDPRGCRVRLVEHPARGVAAVLHNPAGDALLKLRNVEALRRLERVSRRRVQS